MISIADVRKRLNYLPKTSYLNENFEIYKTKANNAIRSKNPSTLLTCIESSRNQKAVDLNSVLNCFETLCEVGSIGNINRATNYICEEVLPKSRDAFALNNLLKQRLGRLKHKNSTKISKKFDSVFNGVNDSMVKMQDALTIKTSAPAASSTGSNDSTPVEEAYEKMIETSIKYINCDRVLENYDSISLRFNLDKLFIENSYVNGIKDTINELCHMVDTYKMADNIKLNTVIECALYGLDTNKVSYERSQILQAACEYFLMKSNGRHICKSILENTVFFDKETDMKGLEYITEEDPEEEANINETVQNAIYSFVNEVEIEKDGRVINNPAAKFGGKDKSLGSKILNKAYINQTGEKFSMISKDAVEANHRGSPVHAARSYEHYEKMLNSTDDIVKLYNNFIDGELDKIMKLSDTIFAGIEIHEALPGTLTFYNNLASMIKEIKGKYKMSDDEIRRYAKAEFFDLPDNADKCREIIKFRMDYIKTMNSFFKNLLLTDKTIFESVFGFFGDEKSNAAVADMYPDATINASVLQAIANNEEKYTSKGFIDFRSIGCGVVYATKEHTGLDSYTDIRKLVNYSREYDCIIFGHGKSENSKESATLGLLTRVKEMEAIIKSGELTEDNKRELKDHMVACGLKETKIPTNMNELKQVAKRLGIMSLMGDKTKKWTIQPIRVESGGTYTDMNELIRAVIKEGKKNILIMSCNPAHHELADDIKKSNKDVKIKMMTNTLLIESKEMYDNDSIEYTIASLHEYYSNLAKYNGINYHDDDYLNECMMFIENDDLMELITEDNIISKGWKVIKALLDKLLGAIVGFGKFIIRTLSACVEKIRGIMNKDYKKGDPIKLKTIKTDPSGKAQIVEATVSNPKEAGKVVGDALNAIAQTAKNFNSKFENATKKMEREVEKRERTGTSTGNITSQNSSYRLNFKNQDEVVKWINELSYYNARGYMISMEPIRENHDFNKIFEDFKKNNEESDYPEKKLKKLVESLYATNVDNAVEGTPSLLSWIRRIFILGTCAINPVLAAVLAIADIFTTIHMDRKNAERMLKCFKTEKEKSEKKLSELTDKEDKDRMKDYIKSLDKVIDKIDIYHSQLLTDEEEDRKYDSSSNSFNSFSNILSDDEDEDIDALLKELEDDDFDWDSFGEAAASCIPVLSALMEEMTNTKDRVNNIDFKDKKFISLFSEDDLKNLATFSTMYPNCIDPYLVYDSINEYYYDIKNNIVKFSNSIYRFNAINACTEAMDIIKNHNNPVEYKDIYEATYNMNNMVRGLKAIELFATAMNSGYYMVEASITNKLKLASETLKRSLVNLSDKEKAVSRTIDSNMNRLAKSVEQAFTNDSRESIIRGSIIPSASKILKMIIVGAATWNIQPAIAVIGVLGYIGCSKKFEIKQRQMIVDEIEIELKMCNKYIEMAESKNDTAALKNLYTIQRDLERQRQKVKYHMAIKGVKMIDPKDTNRKGVDY